MIRQNTTSSDPKHIGAFYPLLPFISPRHLNKPKGPLTITRAIIRQRVTQHALRAGPYDGIAGVSRSRAAGEERVRRVRVEGLLLDLVVRCVLLVVQAPGQTQVASVLVDAAHVPAAGIRQETALIHIWKTERSAEGPRSIFRLQKGSLCAALAAFLALSSDT